MLAENASKEQFFFSLQPPPRHPKKTKTSVEKLQSGKKQAC